MEENYESSINDTEASFEERRAYAEGMRGVEIAPGKRPTRTHFVQLVTAFLAWIVALASEAKPAPHPANLDLEQLADIAKWADGENVLFVYDDENEILHRAILAPGQEEDFHVDVRDALATMSLDLDEMVVLFTEPLVGPGEGQVHYGLVVWAGDDGIERAPIAVYDDMGPAASPRIWPGGFGVA